MIPLSLLAMLLASGCATNTGQGEPVTAENAVEISTDPAAEAVDDTPGISGPGAQAAEQPVEPVIPERPFPDDSLYPILVAEFALRRRQYDIALENYMEQAPLLGDAGVAAHTARLAQFMRRDAEAAAATDLWVKLEPDNLEARLGLANLLVTGGDIEGALDAMEAVVKAGGNANFTSLLNGYAELDSRRQLELLRRVSALLEELPDDIQLRLSQVLMLEALGRQQEALAQLQPIFEREPLQLQAVVQEAKLRLELGQFDNVFTRMEQAMAANPANNRLRLQYARLLTQTDMAEAERQFQKLLDVAPQDPDLLFSMALIKRELKDLDGARENLERLLSINRRTDEAHYYLGKTAEEQGRTDDAMVHYMQVQPGRDFGAATDRLAQILLAEGRTAELGAYFDGLRQRHRQLAEQLFALEAERLMAAQYLPDAGAVLDRALEDFPGSIALRYSRSILAERLGNFALAEEDLQSIIDNNPNNATALNALGYMLTNRSARFEEAEDLIRRALELKPDDPAILDSMGWVKYRLGDYPAALSYLRRAYKAFPDPEVAAHLGEVLWAMGEQRKARTVWDRALADRPDHKILNETLQRLGVELADY